jgi:predicted nucleotidyltransferase
MDPAASVLFGKTRQAVLSALFERGADGIYVRELERQTGISTGALHHELRQLMQADLVEKTKDGNRVVYRINDSHPIYTELRGIIEKTCGVPAQVRAALGDLESDIDFAAIFGSTARGTSHAGSDIDLLLVGELTQSKLIDHIQPLEERLHREIGFRLYTREEFNKRRQSDPFLTRVLSRPLIPIIGAIDSACEEENQGVGLH